MIQLRAWRVANRRGDDVMQHVLSMALIALGVMSVVFAQGEVRAPRTDSGPLRPPAVPLITNDPYLSIWSFNDRLNDADTRHWTGKPHTLLSLIRVDAKAYRLMGAQPSATEALKQISLDVLPTRTIYTFS